MITKLPSSWTNIQLRKVFGLFGNIRWSMVRGGHAIIRFKHHDQALHAMGHLHEHKIQGHRLKIRFATNADRLQQIGDNTVYIRNLPKDYNQRSLEILFLVYGKLSFTWIDNNRTGFAMYVTHIKSTQFRRRV